jgi:hypothetical protein
VEREPGALQALQKYLHEGAYRTRTPFTGAYRSVNSQGTSELTRNNKQTLTSPFKVSDTTIKLPTDTPDGSDTTQRDEDLEAGYGPTTLHLLYCTKKGRYTFDLHQDLITDIKNDRYLFLMLRSRYYEHRGKLKKYWSLKTLHSINFAKVS